MILRFMGIGLLLSLIVLGFGWGRVLLPQLLARTVLVFLGTVVCLAAARKSVDVFVSAPSTATSLNGDVNLADQETATGEPDMETNAGESGGESGGPVEEESNREEPMPESPEESTSEDLGDDAEVEELAEMVSQTMAEDENSG